MGEYLMEGAVWLGLGLCAPSFWPKGEVAARDTCELGETGALDDLENEVEMRKDSPGNQDK